MKESSSPKKGHIYFFIILMILICLWAIFGEKGLVDVYRLRKERAGLEEYNRRLEEENRELEKKIHLLKTDRRYIEYMARKELGMIGKNEVIYRFRDEGDTP